MKLAILTDLHANREAVQTCLAQARAAGVDRFAFIGDYVGYGADPAWVVDQVRSLVEQEGALAVLGNHDNATVREPSAAMDPEAAATSQWTRSQLDASQLKFLGSLPLTATLGHCLFVHANAWAPAEWGYIHSRGDAVRSLQATDRLYTFCGHVHEPRLYHMSATAKVLDFQPVPGVAQSGAATVVRGRTRQPRRRAAVGRPKRRRRHGRAGGAALFTGSNPPRRWRSYTGGSTAARRARRCRC